MGIGELNQSDLHEQLKWEYCIDSAQTEVSIDGYIADVCIGDEIIEIQTARLGRLRAKLEHLAKTYSVRVVYPLAMRKTITKVDKKGRILSTRKSPFRGRFTDAFFELDDIASLVPCGNLTLEVISVDITEYRCDDGKGRRSRKGVSIVGRKLNHIIDRKVFWDLADYLSVLPSGLPAEFTNADLCKLVGWDECTAQTISRTLRKVGALEMCGKRSRSNLYRRFVGPVEQTLKGRSFV